MSAFVYGRITAEQKQEGVRSEKAENKLVTAIAALIPAEILAAHELLLGWTTKTENEVTTITDPDPLRWGLVVLGMLAVVLFVVGRRTGNPSQPWTSRDTLRAIIPGLAFLAWTGLIGTSALTPWIGTLSFAWVGLGAIALGILLAMLSRIVTPAERK